MRGRTALQSCFPSFVREYSTHGGISENDSRWIRFSFFEIFYHIGKGLGTDPVKLLHTLLEPYLLKVTDDPDDQDSPFLCNDIDKTPWMD
jgi:hypothetical protein